MKLPLVVTSLGMLGCISMIAGAKQAELDSGLTCSESYQIRVNQSQIERGRDAHASSWIPVEISRDASRPDCTNEVLINSGTDLNWRLDSGTHILDIEPYDSRRNRLLTSASGDGWIFKLPPGSAHEVLWLRVDKPSFVSPGSYYGYILLSEKNRDLHILSATEQISTQFVYEVEPSASMSFEASWGTNSKTYFNVNLGDLTQGSNRVFDMVLKSNTDVSVQVSSENEGYLMHEANSRYRIAYNLSLKHIAVDLSAPSLLPLSFEGTYENWRIPILISVPAASPMMLAGSYRDTIYVDVFPRY